MVARLASSRLVPAALVAVVFALLATAPFWIGSGYALGVLVLCNLWAVFASSWDFMSGQTGRENFGHGMFVGTGAYTAALLNLHTGLSPAACLPIAGIDQIAHD